MARQSGVHPIARHGALRRRSGWRSLLTFLTAFFAVVTLSIASVALIALWQFQSGLDIVDIGGGEDVPPPSVGAYPGGFNVFIVGSDTRVGQGGLGGEDPGSTLNDVNILLHVSADHSRAIAVSIPRDLVIPFPECTDPQTGETFPESEGQPINEALRRGGLPCAVEAVSDLTGLEIQFAGLVTFQGVVEMSNAVGGVPVCITAPINDPRSGLVLDTAGEHVLSGPDALAFLRTRHGVGDGSDLGRISSQQVFLSSLVRKLKSNETLSNPVRLYELAGVVRENMTLSSSMASLDTLVALAMALKDVELENVLFVQYPTVYRETDPWYGKLASEDAIASALFSAIAADQPFGLGSQEERPGSVPDPDAPTASPEPTEPGTATPSPTGTATPEPELPTIEGLPGQTAAERTCSVASGG
ncbi:LCP family protein [Lysobacter korlensis]|uniref:LCP family protein n=1 Tax=Lysobacter korlensis TaxID=553636 RepID=A0ABV6RUL7_9GAMM